MASLSNQLLLQDVLPWIKGGSITTTEHSSILIHDTLETSGRFLLHLTAKEGATKRNARILWLCCTAGQNKRLIEQALSKIESTTRGSKTDRSKISVRSVVQEMNHAIENHTRSSSDIEFDPHKFVRELYYSVRAWYQETAECPAYVFVEDVSALANLVGQRLSYAFVFQLHTMQEERNANQGSGKAELSLLVSCASDEQLISHSSTSSSPWIGAGGRQHSSMQQAESSGPLWECSLVELANWIVDVVPLTTGISRTVHGRLILTPKSLGSASDAVVVNYCLGENQVWATRVYSSNQLC